MAGSNTYSNESYAIIGACEIRIRISVALQVAATASA